MIKDISVVFLAANRLDAARSSAGSNHLKQLHVRRTQDYPARITFVVGSGIDLCSWIEPLAAMWNQYPTIFIISYIVFEIMQ